MNKLKFELNNIVDFSGPNSIEYNNEIEITIHYRRHSKELFVSHFFVPNKNRRNNIGTKYYKYIKEYAYNNENINTFKFHIKKNSSSRIWLQSLNEEYRKTKVSGVGEVYQIDY